MPDATHRNRLDAEASPYLQQHADNPVHWQPWDNEALTAATERDVPIFLSIGYSACHWCHVMEDESFQDESVASVLNEQFVPIKVDKEERPDIDSIYQTICQLVTGGGGWPLSVWLTPNQRPFYVGTYFPPAARGRVPGFESLLENIANSWADPDQRPEMERRAEQWTDAIEGELEDVPDQPGEPPDTETDVLATTAHRAVKSADREHGGFGSGQKFPQTGRIRALLRAYERTGRSVYREVAREALDAMIHGGLFDHVGGGFHRYTTDREWVVPHFEKMLYDNAEITRMLLSGFQLTGHDRYADAARQTLAFTERELTHPEGGFYATLDAQSEGEEGTFYVWTPEAIETALTDEVTGIVCDRYGVTESGNFEDGQTVLTVHTDIDTLAKQYDRSAVEIETTLETAREQLFEHREQRPRPGRDEKVLAGWNGLMITAFAEGSLVLDAPELAETAGRVLSFVRDRLWDGSRISRREKDGDVSGAGYLEDYAFLGRGALSLYEATGAIKPLGFALDLAETIEREFWDETERTLYFTPESGESMIARPQELSDQSTPASAGVATSLLLALDGFVDHDRFGSIAETVLATHTGKIESDPLRHVSLALAADEHAFGPTELTIAAETLPASFREQLATTYLPRRLLAARPPTAEGLTEWLEALDLENAPPIWDGREQIDGEPTAYLCENFTCSPPKTELTDALAWRTERTE